MVPDGPLKARQDHGRDAIGILALIIWYATKGFNTASPGDKTVLLPSQVKRSQYREMAED